VATQLLQAKVFSPFEVYYEGPVSSLTATSAKGVFDVLFDHANFISLLSPGPVVLHTPYGERAIKINRGILKVHNNYVVLFANV